MSTKKRLQKHKADLYILTQSDSRTKEKLLQEAPNSLILSICDCARHLLSGQVPLTNSQRKRLSKHKNVFRSLTSRSLPVSSKRAQLKKGGRDKYRALSALLRATGNRLEQLKGKSSTSPNLRDGELDRLVGQFRRFSPLKEEEEEEEDHGEEN